MRQKSIRGGKLKAPLTHPTDRYTAFAELLREQLLIDSSFKATYLNKVFESKLSNGALSASEAVRRERAITKWLSREAINKDTNQRIMFADEEDFLFIDSKGFPVSARDVINWCRKQITALLGNEIDWEKLKGSFSGGASTSVKRGCGTVPRKYQVGKNITREAFMAYAHLSQFAQVMPRDLVVVPGNVMFTVPKTSEIDRVACKEPELNMYCQKAVGDYIRSRLKTVGIDLNDQSVNQELARIGSVDGTLATIDLSSASDSVTKQIVLEMLPFEWSSLMFDLRSPVTLVNGELHENEMIASMGNGFTFELESLIFWVLTRCCAFYTHTKGRVSVYGDDIICPVGVKDSLESTLEFFGFSLNREKSFWDGSFRESCGKHWHSGVDVSPFYVKDLPKTIPDWNLLLNSLRKWSDTSGICDPRYYDLWQLFSELVPRPLHGSDDLDRKDALVVPYMRNIALVKPLVKVNEATKRKYQVGAYVQWLDTNEQRTITEIPDAVEQFAVEGKLVMRRTRVRRTADTRNIPVFPQEMGIAVTAR